MAAQIPDLEVSTEKDRLYLTVVSNVMIKMNNNMHTHRNKCEVTADGLDSECRNMGYL